jgi:hypothetical protein
MHFPGYLPRSLLGEVQNEQIETQQPRGHDRALVCHRSRHTLAGVSVRRDGLVGLRMHHRVEGADHVVSGGSEVRVGLKHTESSIY